MAKDLAKEISIIDQKTGKPKIDPKTKKQKIEYLFTDLGLRLSEISKRQMDISRRARQLSEYQKKYRRREPKQPMKGRTIQLANELNLSLLILEDQVAAMQKDFRRTYFEPKSTVAKRIDDYQESLEQNVPSKEALEAQEKPKPPKELTKEERYRRLQDMGDILDVLRDDLRKERMSPYFEGLVEYRLKMDGASPGEREEFEKYWSLTSTISRILALDPAAYFDFTQPTLKAEIKTLYKEVADLIGRAKTELKVWW